MKEKIKNSWIYKNNWIFLFIIIGIIGIIGTYERRYKKEHGLYTIGSVYRIEGTRGGFQVFFKYSYMGKEYKSNFIGHIEREDFENRHFYIQFLQNNPERCLILDEVPDCIGEAPYYGWKTLPKCWGEDSDAR